MVTSRRTSDKNRLIAFVVYYLVWLIMITAALFPDKAWWAFSVYAYVDEFSRNLILSFFGIIPVVLYFLKTNIDREIEVGVDDSSSSKYLLGSLIILLGSIALFILFRAEAFYLGDGYTLLSTLASENPILKQREIGESSVHLWVRDIFGTGETAALLSYQTISITAGAISTISLFLFSRKQYRNLFHSLIFILILASGGYALLWFGYVENYSLFVLFVSIYSLIGYLAVSGKISYYWIIPPLVFAIIMHVMGVTLIPSAFYILLTQPGPKKLLSRIPKSGKIIAGLTVLVLVLVPFIYVYNNSYFFKLSLVPIFGNRFTVDGYTLFSITHLLDVINLLILVVPLTMLTLTLLFINRQHLLPLSIKAWYLIILIVSVFLALFLFDPKIGMPRDWDLFSFAGLPLMLLSSLLLFSLLKKKIITRSVLILALSMNLMFLTPRVYTQTSYNHALDQFRQYISWDPLKNRSGMSMLADHYNKLGDTAQAAIEIERWREEYPEWQQNRVAMKMSNEGYIDESINIYKDIIKNNPIYPAAYSNLGLAYMKLMNLDSAGVYLEIAQGMNPYNHRVLANLGMYHFHKKNYTKAEELFERALERDSLISTAVIGMLNTYKMKNEREKFYKYLTRVVWYKEAPVEYSKEMAEYYLSQGNYIDAGRVLGFAVKYKGLDSMYINNIKLKYPQLKIE